MIISLDVDKVFEKNRTSHHVKNIGEIKNSWNIPKHSKSNYSKPIANIKLNGEKLEAIPLKSGTTQGCLVSIYSI